MKKAALLLSLFVAFVFSNGARAQYQCSAKTFSRGGSDPWPFGKELDFPWHGVQGTWMAEIKGCESYFSIKTVKLNSKTEERHLSIQEFDPYTCEVISRGVGFEKGKVVRARMSGLSTGTYDVRIHVFNRADLKGTTGSRMSSGGRTVYMMSMSKSWTEKAENVALTKIASDASALCERAK
jgi:hypothetical protein